MRLRVSRIRDEAQGVRSFELQALDGDALPRFTAGAHLTFMLPGDGAALVERKYSIASDPADGERYEIAVLLDPGSRGGSRYMHEVVAEGDVLEVTAPMNDFRLVEGAERSILIAGGIGITPILAMLRTLAASDSALEVHYAASNPERFAFRDAVETIAGDRAEFYVGGRASGTGMELELVLESPLPGTHVYACGPRRMIEAVRDTAAEKGWLPTQIHFESFASGVLPGDTPVCVELARSGMTVEVPADSSILDAMLEAGVWASYQCRRGECGSCMTTVLEGEPDHRDVCLTAADRKTYMCPCVSRAKGDSLVLDL